MNKIIKVFLASSIIVASSFAVNPINKNLPKLDAGGKSLNEAGKDLGGFFNEDKFKQMGNKLLDKESFNNMLSVGSREVQFGMGPAMLTCVEPTINFNFSTNICQNAREVAGEIADKLTGFLEEGIKLGPCKIGASVNPECALNNLKKKCDEQVEKFMTAAEDKIKDVMMERMGSKEALEKYKKEREERDKNKSWGQVANGERKKDISVQLGLSDTALFNALPDFMQMARPSNGESLKSKSDDDCEEDSTDPYKIYVKVYCEKNDPECNNSGKSKISSKTGATINPGEKEISDAENENKKSDFINSQINDTGSNGSASQRHLAQCMIDLGAHLINPNQQDYAEKLAPLYFLCSPENVRRGTRADIKQSIREMIDTLSNKGLAPTPEASAVIEQSILDGLKNAGCFDKTSLADSTKCESDFFGGKGKNSVAEIFDVRQKVLEDKIDLQMALFTTILEQTYPDEFLDTSDGALMKIPPQKRAWFIERAKKQDMEEAMLKSFALRITESKKALAKLSLQKAKECAKPFYFTAAIGDIMTNSTAAAVGSAEQTQNLMKNGTDAVKDMVNGKINQAASRVPGGSAAANRANQAINSRI